MPITIICKKCGNKISFNEIDMLGIDDDVFCKKCKRLLIENKHYLWKIWREMSLPKGLISLWLEDHIEVYDSQGITRMLIS